jgi:hypothetical protein
MLEGCSRPASGTVQDGRRNRTTGVLGWGLGLALAALVAATLAPTAPASELIARDGTGVELKVGPGGRAILSYTRGGRRFHVAAWGAVDAVHPSADGRQVSFHLDYAPAGAARVRDLCRPYDGPPLAWLVTACTAPDGTHWAVQAWQRRLPNYGVPWPPDRDASELRLAHWSGPVARLTVRVNWAYRRFDHLFGRLTYRGVPVHGFASTPSGEPLDSFGRNLYVDTFDSAYGAGWRRENGFLLHHPTGVFCYGFYRHAARPSGEGRRYRATVIGPGVTPDVSWEGRPLRPYSRARDLQLHVEQRDVYRGDDVCSPV